MKPNHVVNTPLFQAEVDYDISHASIKCNADKNGARVFEVKDYYKRIRRVLAYSIDDAKDAVNGNFSYSSDS